MRYIQDELYDSVKGEHGFKVKDEGEEEHDGTVGEALKHTLNFYDNNHTVFASKQPAQTLSPTETAAFNAVLAILEGETDAKDLYRLEDTHWQVLKKVTAWTFPMTPWWREQERLTAIIEDAIKEHPDEEKKRERDAKKAAKATADDADNHARGKGRTKAASKA